MDEPLARELVAGLLRKKGYLVRSIASGSGVPKNSRLELKKDGDTLTCAVKMSDGGRIKFDRNDDGTYKVLSDVDWVIHATPSGERTVSVSAFRADRVRQAFDSNFAALSKRGMGHIPLWVNPAPEGGWRRTGSGFGKDAMWREEISLDVTAIADEPDDGLKSVGLLDELKQIASDRLGVSIDALEIEVRVRG